MKGSAARPDWFFRFFAAYAAGTLVILGALYVDFFTHLFDPDPRSGSIVVRLLVGLVLVPAALLVSALILRRAPRNVTGLFLLMYASAVMYDSLRDGSPLQPLSNLFTSGYLGLWLLPLYFPDGSVYPRRFQSQIRIHSVVTAIFFIGIAFFRPTVDVATAVGEIEQIANPLMIPTPTQFVNIVGLVQAALWLSTVLMIIPSIILRYRASSGTVRQQIKWFVWTFTILIASFLLLLPTFTETGTVDPERYGIFGGMVLLYQFIFFPAGPLVAVAIAIFRYRLYDIDIIIRKTLIYSVLTAILAVIYFGGVVLAQQLFRTATGQGSDLAIVLSTLLIAALFSPLRRRIQETIDRRFFRRKYDAEQTLARFNQSLRDEVDIEVLKSQLVGVVDETMQPAEVRVWLKEEGV